jgi:iron(III) transport system substrate-binding protein
MIRDLGERATELAVRAWVANLATPIVRDDAQLLQAIEDGRCSLGIVNTDDLARFARDQPMTAVAGYLPPASSGGSYISIVGAAVTRHANNPAGALRLLEWLSSDKGQELLAREDLEVPIGDLDEWSALQISPIDLAGVAYYYEDVVRLMERARYGRAQ